MPTVRFDDESEGLAPGTGVAASGVSRDVARVSANVQLSDHLGKFVAGEVMHRFAAESLTDKLKGRNAIHVSVSWG